MTTIATFMGTQTWLDDDEYGDCTKCGWGTKPDRICAACCDEMLDDRSAFGRSGPAAVARLSSTARLAA